MANSINLLDPSLGIQSILDSAETSNLPQARQLASNTLAEAGLDELYAPANSKMLIEQALCPKVGDGSLLQPEVFSGNLASCLKSLTASGDEAALELVKQELEPLLENKKLFQAYIGLMIGG